MKKTMNEKLNYYMSLNYPATVEQYEEDDKISFGLQIPDLPGVWASGESIEDAFIDLIETKKLWLETALEKGIDIPEPVSEKDFSGKFVLRLDSQLHMSLTRAAKQNKCSLNQHISTILRNQIRYSGLISEVRALGKLYKKQSDDLQKELKQVYLRITSLEQAFSALSGVQWSTPLIVAEGEHKKGGWGKHVAAYTPSMEEAGHTPTTGSMDILGFTCILK